MRFCQKNKKTKKILPVSIASIAKYNTYEKVKRCKAKIEISIG